jgi:hypothetical protein
MQSINFNLLYQAFENKSSGADGTEMWVAWSVPRKEALDTSLNLGTVLFVGHGDVSVRENVEVTSCILERLVICDGVDLCM